MDLFKILKQFQKIEPGEEFKKNSLSLILGSSRPSARPGVLEIIFKNLELGASLALAGLLVFMIVGGFSAWRFLSPLQITNLDPAGLRAEAQAIDIQIRLANLNYSGEAPAGNLSETTPSSIISRETSSGGDNGGSQSAIAATHPASTSISIDEALQELSE